MDVDALRLKLKNHGHEHLLKFWDTLSNEEKTHLYEDLSSIDYASINQYYKHCMDSLRKAEAGEKVDDHIQPLPSETFGSISKSPPELLKKYENEGFQQISNSKVAVLLLAGGQGTRLGVNYPKGMYDVGLPSHKTLYQLQAERILKVQELAREATGAPGIVPWYIMTSEHTMEPTRQFFEKHGYFGLSKDNVVFFEQYTLPCLEFDGKVILDKPHSVARAPDGNGGLYKALNNRGILNDMIKRGIQYVHAYCVDNILVKMADPVFLGFCIRKSACCGAKVVEKAFPTEAVGVVCKVDNVYQVVEYSEITLTTAERRNSDGTLTFNAGNICNHFFTVDFLKMVVREREHELLHHVAKKKIPYVDEGGQSIKPSTTNGIKMEKFVFDVFQFASNFAVWEVLREDEFSPLKNADGAKKDTPTTSREDLFNLHQRVIQKAGGKIITEDGTPVPDASCSAETNGNSNNANSNHKNQVVCEISPLVTYAGEGLEKLVKGQTFTEPVVFKDPKESVHANSD